MAVAFGLQAAGFTATELNTEAAVSLDPDAGSFTVSRSALTLRAKVPGIDGARFQEIADGAEKNCPISKVLKAEITLVATLRGVQRRRRTPCGPTSRSAAAPRLSDRSRARRSVEHRSGQRPEFTQ